VDDSSDLVYEVRIVNYDCDIFINFYLFYLRKPILIKVLNLVSKNLKPLYGINSERLIFITL
jgi:hypothetical protein